MIKNNNIKQISGAVGATLGLALSKVIDQNGKFLIITPTHESSLNCLRDLAFFAPSQSTSLLPDWGTIPFELVSPKTSVTAKRIQALAILKDKNPSVVVSSAQTIIQRSLPIDLLLRNSVELDIKCNITRKELLRVIENGGYERTSLVEAVGEYAVRGAVIDIYCTSEGPPIRIRWDKERLLALEKFDLQTQRTVDEIENIKISPVREVLNDLQTAKNLEKLKQRSKELEVPTSETNRLLSLLKANADFPGIELLQPILIGETESILDICQENTTIILIDPNKIANTIETRDLYLDQRVEYLKTQHELFPEKKQLYDNWETISTKLKNFAKIEINQLNLESESKLNLWNMRSLPLSKLRANFERKRLTGEAFNTLIKELRTWRAQSYKIVFAIQSALRAKTLRRMLSEHKIEVNNEEMSFEQWQNHADLLPVAVVSGNITSGFELLDDKLVVIAESDLFPHISTRTGETSKRSLKRLLQSISLLKEGQFVVHVDYGIGIYRGLHHVALENRGYDFLRIQYADSRLYVPVHHIRKIQPFQGAEQKQPQLDRLSSPRWNKVKRKIRESLIILAGDLIKLYATRSVAKGIIFEPQNSEDERFAESFIYDETPDQQKAIEEALADMAGERPMDRLICGDVGFGKTEVAIRAAYKAFQHRRQVAVLVPTTILTDQHVSTFKERFAEYPVEIRGLSRFYSDAENKNTLEALASGEVDIVIGTHKLLSPSIKFFDLGLLIIDEEHRFGVKQKERIKQIKQNVDVLALTATPIPRTLHQSLLNIRDMSVILTPPAARQVISTYVAMHDDGLIRDVILREINRGGQVFFVHNQVQGIELIAAGIQALVPEARIDFAHGQMHEDTLERKMKRFLSHQIDVLVSTTIVESGIDIPRANTLIVNHADKFGLAQLYQLRGRVGRSNIQAYAYFIIPKSRKLTIEAEERLKVLQSIDELGRGFHLALRDLEIRGAGNLLGKEQSGNVSAVGFELYMQILNEAVMHLKDESISPSESIDPELKLNLSAFIPEYFIPDISERLILYQRLAGVEAPEEIDPLIEEMNDRFGNLPKEMADYCELMRYRALLRQYAVLKAEFSRERLLLTLSAEGRFDTEKILGLVKQHPEKFRFGKGLTLAIAFPEAKVPNIEIIYMETFKLFKLISASSMI